MKSWEEVASVLLEEILGFSNWTRAQPSCDTSLMDQASCPFLQWPHCSATLCRCSLLCSCGSLYTINHGAVMWLKVLPTQLQRAVCVHHTHRTGLFIYTAFTEARAPNAHHFHCHDDSSCCGYHLLSLPLQLESGDLTKGGWAGDRQEIPSAQGSPPSTCSPCRCAVRTHGHRKLCITSTYTYIHSVIVVPEGPSHFLSVFQAQAC